MLSLNVDYSALELRILKDKGLLVKKPPYKPRRKSEEIVISRTTPEGAQYVVGIDPAYNKRDAADTFAAFAHVYGLTREEAKATLRARQAINEVLSKKKVKYGWYSERAVDMGGAVVVWETPLGDEVEVTGVTSDLEGKGYAYEDKMFVGEVTRYLRTTTRSNTRTVLFDDPDDDP